MPLYDVNRGFTQRLGVDVSVEPQNHGNVVSGCGGVELVENPHAVLSRREDQFCVTAGMVRERCVDGHCRSWR